MPQEHIQPSVSAAAHNEELTRDTHQAQENIDDLDAILNDIEEILETNAEEYVHGFVQKGGE